MTVEQNVINVLNEDIVHRINFQFASVRISGNDYEVIVRAIRHRHITCQHNTILASVGAGAYAHDLGNHCNVLNLPFANPQSVQEKALVIHECTHAIEDYHGVSLPLLVSEGAAFLAQMMYAFLATDGGFPYGDAGLDPNEMGVFITAHNIARRILTTRGGYIVRPDEQLSLQNAIGSVNLYGRSRIHRVEYNGI